MTTTLHKTPRLYTTQSFKNTDIALDKDQTHYLRNVLRLDCGALIRLFNGHDGEWSAEIVTIDKKSTRLTLRDHIKQQPPPPQPVYLLFAPIKKQRLDILIEKAVELGCTHLHPVITERTENRNIKPERIQNQIIEATEQCERLDLPSFTPPSPLKHTITNWTHTPKIHWAAERIDNTPLSHLSPPAAFLIGPEGGFSEDETEFLNSQNTIIPVNLGPRILRAETAALYCLSQVK